jgi:uncharacterized damage-inducible protein DinB
MQPATELQAQVGISLNDLIEYTDWQRTQWRDFLLQHDLLHVSLGPNGDGRFQTIAELIRHIFSAEKRYIDRLSDRPLTDPATIPCDTVEKLFTCGQQSRRCLNDFIASRRPSDWEAIQEFSMMNRNFRLTTRKIIVHVLLHEIRHWPQVATIARLNGFPVRPQDFLLSPVLGDPFA